MILTLLKVKIVNNKSYCESGVTLAANVTPNLFLFGRFSGGFRGQSDLYFVCGRGVPLHIFEEKKYIHIYSPSLT